MFGFLKDKLKGALSVFSKKVEQEAVPVPKEEVKEEIKAEPKKEILKEIKPAEAKPVEVKPVEVKKNFVKVCPKCGSSDVKTEMDNAAKVNYGAPLNCICESCGFRNVVFPEVAEDNLEEFRRQIKKTEVKKEEAKAVPKVEEKKIIVEKPKVEVKKAELKKEEIKVVPKVEEKQVERKVEKVEPVVDKKVEVKVEEKKAEEKIEPKEEKKGFFSRLTSKISEAVTTTSISDSKFDELFWDLEIVLLENNVAVEVIDKIKSDLKQSIVDKPIHRGKVEETVISSLKNSISGLFEFSKVDLLEKAKSKKPFVICFVGVNGSGKTTSIAKIANLLLKNKLSVVLAAADTFRAAAIDQLQLHADKLGVKLIRYDYGADAAAVAFDAVKYAQAKSKDVVLIDTAGRLHSNHNLVEEMKKIVRVSKPDMIVFVGESITGNDCVEQAKQFNEAVHIDGIILSKADIDEKGGAAISVSYVTKKPILYIGTGQEYDDLEVFNKEKVLASVGL